MNKKVCLLKGGTSTEREVSLSASVYIKSALEELGYSVTEFDYDGDVTSMVSFLTKTKPDCVFNGLYGGHGENGSVQGLLNMLRIPYTHSGVGASSIAMNKNVARVLFRLNDIPVADGKVVNWEQFAKNPDMEYPFVVKEIDGGSSVGVSIVQSVGDISRINWSFKSEVLVEKYIPGREFTVGMIANKAVAVTEVLVDSGFYDYHSKYTAGCSRHVLPADISDELKARICELAEKAHRVVGCNGISRVDFRYDVECDQLYVMEINNQPGMTSTSLLPEQAKFCGISFNQLVQMMVEGACYDI